LHITWRVVELWTVPAEELLAANDVGLIPWVPLAQFQGPPEPILEECRRRIDQQAPADERANFLAVTEVLTQLRYKEPGRLSIFGSSQIMIESPLIQGLIAEQMQKDILIVLSARFGPVPVDIRATLQGLQDEARLEDVLDWVVCCPDLAAFRKRLSS
jgi:hypothetical protein